MDLQKKRLKQKRNKGGRGSKTTRTSEDFQLKTIARNHRERGPLGFRVLISGSSSRHGEAQDPRLVPNGEYKPGATGGRGRVR